MYPSNSKEAKRLSARRIRNRRREEGLTEIVVVLPKEQVAELDAVKERWGFSNRGQAVAQLLQNRRELAPQNS